MIADIVQSGLSAWWAPALAFAAGVVSFASPCVFPLVPGYLSFVSGGAAEERRPVLPILLFFAGFASFFSLLGASSLAFRQVLKSQEFQRGAGVVVALVGIFMILYALQAGPARIFAERRPLLQRVRPGLAGAFPLGLAFGVGWTPCIGPVLTGIFAIAAAQGGGLRGALLLFSYSLGLGLPFLLVGLGIRRLVRALEVIKRNYRWIAGASGAVMLAIGVLIATGLWARILAPILPAIQGFNPPI